MRLSFPDQHGILRGKTIVAGDAAKVMRNGCSITTTLLAKDTSHKTVFPVFTAGGGFGMPEMEGGGDFLMIADPTTFRVLPWAPQTGWVLCDIYFQNGKPVPFSTRHLYRQVLSRLGDAGFDYIAGLEVEFHVFKIENPRLDPADAGWPSEPPEVSVPPPATSISLRRVLISWNPSWRRSGVTWWRSVCRCVRSRSNWDRASASSPSRPKPGSRRPTP